MSDLNLLKPVVLFERLFASGARFADRELLQPASISVTTGVIPSCSGSSLVRIGRTHVVCGIQVKVLPDQPNMGRIVCNVEPGVLCSRSVHPYSSTPRDALALSSKLQRLVDSVIYPNVEVQLNIYSDTQQPSASYVLKLDITVLQDDGCLLDACVPAAVAALRTARWHKLVIPAGIPKNASCTECYKVSDETQSLTISLSPIPVTFGCLPSSFHQKQDITAPLILQPTRQESAVWDIDMGFSQIVLTSTGEVVDFCAVNAFLPNLTKQLTSKSTTGKDFWNLMLQSGLSYARTMQTAIDEACK